MRHFRLALAALTLVAASTSMFADDSSIPYSNVGTVSSTYSVTATTTGSVLGYFAGSEAGYTDFIRLYNVTANTYSGWVLNNHTSSIGEQYNFGSVTGGDQLVFQLLNGVGQVFSSDAAFSFDGINHGYVTPFAGGYLPGGSYNFAPGLYVGMEDLPLGMADLDYNDDQFIFQNVAATKIDTPSVIENPAATPAVPEPSTLVMFGTGVLAAAGAMRRRILGR